MIIKTSDRMVEWCAVEYLSDLLQETFAVELGGAYKGIFFQ